MEKQIKYIRFCFENVTTSDKLTVGKYDKSDIYFLSLHDISENYFNCYDSILHTKQCVEADIILNPSCNIKWHEWNSDQDSEYTLFERINRYPDIVCVELIDEDGTITEIYMPWNNEGVNSDYVNTWQHTRLTETGQLQITISKNFEGFTDV